MMKKSMKEKSFACLYSNYFYRIPNMYIGKKTICLYPFFAFFNLNWRGVIISLLSDLNVTEWFFFSKFNLIRYET